MNTSILESRNTDKKHVTTYVKRDDDVAGKINNTKPPFERQVGNQGMQRIVRRKCNASKKKSIVNASHHYKIVKIWNILPVK